MALIDIKLPEVKIPVSEGQNFTVRGITFEDLDFLISVNAVEINALAAMLAATVGQDSDQADKSAAATMAAMQTTRPTLAAQIIACASGDNSPEAIAIARSLPVTVQTEALIKITHLTFEVNGGIKKFIELLVGTITLIHDLNKADSESSTGSTG